MSWKKIINSEFEKEYFKEGIVNKLKNEYKKYIIFPQKNDIFNAFNFNYNKLKVIILGQDPYHSLNFKYDNKGEKIEIPTMDGIAFSTQGINRPPSLSNIFEEIKNEYIDYKIPETNDLNYWRDQGILLLNTVLTVRRGEPSSHSGKIGWEQFTSNIIKKITLDHKNLVFLLWGKNAKKQKINITNNNHLILESSHPSPFSYHISFKKNDHFKKTNEFLNKNNKIPINWQTK